ncbi:hypothetical protein CHUAL_001855 [Chamberlinius hualienensis]
MQLIVRVLTLLIIGVTLLIILYITKFTLHSEANQHVSSEDITTDITRSPLWMQLKRHRDAAHHQVIQQLKNEISRLHIKLSYVTKTNNCTYMEENDHKWNIKSIVEDDEIQQTTGNEEHLFTINGQQGTFTT